ncbi:hypothetical protein V1477_016263 [Vespula maculifrons]|uniref:Uncharacterized protein n=3 Tax=Vespula TaxID=7451 RepID=A0A834UAF4_VESPE|nr:hypothetical protein HZH66_006760 [Vespula vulgaris]KAF7425652.1 hypothetical protein H0235_008090 [Vespula pensylvanica]
MFETPIPSRNCIGTPDRITDLSYININCSECKHATRKGEVEGGEGRVGEGCVVTSVPGGPHLQRIGTLYTF